MQDAPVPTEQPSLEAVRAAKRHALEMLGQCLPLVGVGIAQVRGRLGLKVNLRSSVCAGVAMPEQIDGVPVRYEVVGGAKPHG